MPPSPGFSFGQIWRPAGGGTEESWASFQGWWFVEVDRRRGVGAVWWMPRAAICLCGGSELVDGDLQSRRKPSPVVHWAGSGYVFGRRNLLGALSRVTLSLSWRASLGENHIFLDGRWRHPGCRDHHGGIVFRSLVSVVLP
uniref:Uncharacterized protein n=1 Tax=Oryza nivara TaxID=4536 RepID=A0A0E0H5M3_ORYNI